jgi:hypothetical protein
MVDSPHRRAEARLGAHEHESVWSRYDLNRTRANDRLASRSRAHVRATREFRTPYRRRRFAMSSNALICKE